MRVLDRLVAVLLALLVTAAGVITAIEVIVALAGHPSVIVPWHRLAGQARPLTIGSNEVFGISVAVAIVGILLLWAALHRTRPSAFALIPLDERRSAVDSGATRRALTRAAAERAARVGGVYRSSARMPRRTLRIVATTRLRDTGDLREDVTARVQEWIDGLGLTRPPSVSVRLRRKGV